MAGQFYLNPLVVKRTLSPGRNVLKDTSLQTRPKIDAGDASFPMGSIY